MQKIIINIYEKINLTFPSEIEYGWNFWLKVSFIDCEYATIFFLEILPCAHHVILNEFLFLSKTQKI
jgi:hypothetical protein